MRTCRKATEGFKKVMVNSTMFVPTGRLLGRVRLVEVEKGYICLSSPPITRVSFEKRNYDCSRYPLGWYRDSTEWVFNNCLLD